MQTTEELTPRRTISLRLTVNGVSVTAAVDPRTTLLDLLREELHLTGTKKGCDHGQCGACTVHLDGKRVLSCLKFAASSDGHEVTTIEGIASDGRLHPVQRAFVRHDAFQCGFCTSGQIMSAIDVLAEGKACSAAQVREMMSGNLCRCGAYSNIVTAILEVRRESV